MCAMEKENSLTRQNNNCGNDDNFCGNDSQDVSEFYQRNLLVPEAGIEPARPLFTKAADFKSDVSTNFTTRALFHALLHRLLRWLG